MVKNILHGGGGVATLGSTLASTACSTASPTCRAGANATFSFVLEMPNGLIVDERASAAGLTIVSLSKQYRSQFHPAGGEAERAIADPFMALSVASPEALFRDHGERVSAFELGGVR